MDLAIQKQECYFFSGPHFKNPVAHILYCMKDNILPQKFLKFLTDKDSQNDKFS